MSAVDTTAEVQYERRHGYPSQTMEQARARAAVRRALGWPPIVSLAYPATNRIKAPDYVGRHRAEATS